MIQALKSFKLKLRFEAEDEEEVMREKLNVT